MRLGQRLRVLDETVATRFRRWLTRPSKRAAGLADDNAQSRRPVRFRGYELVPRDGLLHEIVWSGFMRPFLGLCVSLIGVVVIFVRAATGGSWSETKFVPAFLVLAALFAHLSWRWLARPIEEFHDGGTEAGTR